jgi:hypothetical protein
MQSNNEWVSSWKELLMKKDKNNLSLQGNPNWLNQRVNKSWDIFLWLLFVLVLLANIHGITYLQFISTIRDFLFQSYVNVLKLTSLIFPQFFPLDYFDVFLGSIYWGSLYSFFVSLLFVIVIDDYRGITVKQKRLNVFLLFCLSCIAALATCILSKILFTYFPEPEIKFDYWYVTSYFLLLTILAKYLYIFTEKYLLVNAPFGMLLTISELRNLVDILNKKKRTLKDRIIVRRGLSLCKLYLVCYITGLPLDSKKYLECKSILLRISQGDEADNEFSGQITRLLRELEKSQPLSSIHNDLANRAEKSKRQVVFYVDILLSVGQVVKRLRPDVAYEWDGVSIPLPHKVVFPKSITRSDLKRSITYHISRADEYYKNIFFRSVSMVLLAYLAGSVISVSVSYMLIKIYFGSEIAGFRDLLIISFPFLVGIITIRLWESWLRKSHNFLGLEYTIGSLFHWVYLSNVFILLGFEASETLGLILRTIGDRYGFGGLELIFRAITFITLSIYFITNYRYYSYSRYIDSLLVRELITTLKLIGHENLKIKERIEVSRRLSYIKKYLQIYCKRFLVRFDTLEEKQLLGQFFNDLTFSINSLSINIRIGNQGTSALNSYMTKLLVCVLTDSFDQDLVDIQTLQIMSKLDMDRITSQTKIASIVQLIDKSPTVRLILAVILTILMSYLSPSVPSFVSNISSWLQILNP